MPNTEQSIMESGGVPEIELEVEVAGMTKYPVDPTLSVPEMAADAKKTGDAIQAANNAIADILLDIKALKEQTGEDIPLDESGEKSIAEAVGEIEESISGLAGDVLGKIYPVGAVYVTTAESLPAELSAIGTWAEFAMPMTHGDMRRGVRNWNVPEETPFEFGTLHFWMRTE